MLSLLDRPQKYQIAGQVAWITPAGTPMKTPGVGVHFPDDDNGRNLRRNIRPTRGRADLILHKGPDHRVDWVQLRKL